MQSVYCYPNTQLCIVYWNVYDATEKIYNVKKVNDDFIYP